MLAFKEEYDSIIENLKNQATRTPPPSRLLSNQLQMDR
jgi:hypothetical protein